jgi:hypothetical protein
MIFDPAPSDSWHKKFAEAYQKTLLAASDTQTILSMAYWVNFYLDGKCELSAYHYSLAMDIGLITLSSFVASTLTVRKYWKTPLTATLRFICIIIVLSLIAPILNQQRSQPKFFELLPNFKRKTSAIFLPASCFLDPDFGVFENVKDQRINEQIGNPQNTAPCYIIFGILNIIILVLGLIRNYLRAYFDRLNPGESKPKAFKRYFLRLYRGFAFLVIIATTAYAWAHIGYLRAFVTASGWIQLNSNHENPENTVGGIGQLVPLFSMLTILFTFATELVKRPEEPDTGAGTKLGNDSRGDYELSSSGSHRNSA